MSSAEAWAERAAAVQKESKESGNAHNELMKILGEKLKYKRAVRDARIKAQIQREEERRLREELQELDDFEDVVDVSLSLGSDFKEETDKEKEKRATVV